MKTAPKTDGSKILTNMLKYAVYCLGFGMMQLFNCCLEGLKTWNNCNIGWEGIPGHSAGQWPVERRSIYNSHCQYNLAECHRIVMPRDPTYVWATCSQEGTRPRGHLQVYRRDRDGP